MHSFLAPESIYFYIFTYNSFPPNIEKEEYLLLDTLLRIGSDEGQKIKRSCTPTPGYTSEYEE
jgi:hypothetical protein